VVSGEGSRNYSREPRVLQDVLLVLLQRIGCRIVPPEKKKQETVNNPGNRGGYTTSQDVSEADKRAAANAPKGTTTGGSKVGLTGVPKGTPIYLGEQ
jgi:hypothetical protein